MVEKNGSCSTEEHTVRSLFRYFESSKYICLMLDYYEQNRKYPYIAENFCEATTTFNIPLYLEWNIDSYIKV